MPPTVAARAAMRSLVSRHRNTTTAITMADGRMSVQGMKLTISRLRSPRGRRHERQAIGVVVQIERLLPSPRCNSPRSQ